MIKLNNEIEVTFQLENHVRWEQDALRNAFLDLCSTTDLHLQFKSDRLLIKGDVEQVAAAVELTKQKIAEYKPK